MTRPNALSSTSLTCVRYTSGTSASRARVVASSSRTVTDRADAMVLPPSLSFGTTALPRTCAQWSRSSSKPPAPVNSVNRSAHSRNDDVLAPNALP